MVTRMIETLEQRLVHIIASRIRRAGKEEVLNVYEDLIRYVWNSILPTLGRLTAAALLKRALALTRETYAGVQYVHVVPEGLSFSDLRLRLQQASLDELRNGLQTLTLHLFRLLSTLTGDILVQQILEEIENRFRQEGESPRENDLHKNVADEQTETR